MFNEASGEKSVIFLQVLSVLVKVPVCQENIVHAIFSHIYNTSPEAVINKNHFINWCAGKEVTSEVSKLSVNLLQDFIVSNIDKNFDKIEALVKEIFKGILESLSPPDLHSLVADDDLERLVCIFNIVNLLYRKTHLQNFISECFNIAVVEEICLTLLRAGKTDVCENEKCLQLFLTALELLSLIEKDVSKLEKLSSVFADHKSMKYVAWGLTSANQNQVKQALSIIPTIKSDSAVSELSKNIVLLPEQIGPSQEVSTSIRSSDSGSNAVTPRCMCESSYLRSYSQNQINALLLEIKEGHRTQDTKLSEMMKMYEHKIALLAQNYQELQNYAHAKTAALQKADEILMQYRCRQAQSDVEAVRLRSMVIECEYRCEQAVAEYEVALQKSREQKEELDLALCKVRELENYQKEQNELMQSQMNRQYEQKKAFEEEKAKLEEALKSEERKRKALILQMQQVEEDLKSKTKAVHALVEARDESIKKIGELKRSMTKMTLNFEQKQTDLEKDLASARRTIACLEEENDTLEAESKTKVEKLSCRILELEGEKETMEQQLKLKESKVLDLGETISSLNLQFSKISNELLKSERTNKNLESTIEENKSKIAKLEKDVKMSELVCKKNEKLLEQKNEETKSLEIKLEETRLQWKWQMEEKEKCVNGLEAELEKYKESLRNICRILHLEDCLNLI